MKMKPEHFEYLKSTLSPYDTDFSRSLYAEYGFSTRRFQWDLVRHAGIMDWLCNTLYQYLNDDHIQTALNRIIKPIS